jgi:tRNA modification GTPase
VGKSTLLNLLAGRDRSIVTPHPGTTRDIIVESVTLQGYPMQLVDTAGLRDAPCEIEQEGIRRTHHALSQADLCLCLVDASRPLSSDEMEFLAGHDPKKLFVLLNKIDLGQHVFPANLPGLDSMSVSLQKSPAPAEIIAKIVQKAVHFPSGGDHGTMAISSRHKITLSTALVDIKHTLTLLETGLESNFLPAATHARAALDSVGFIFGKNCTEDMLDSIFSRFCVGK